MSHILWASFSYFLSSKLKKQTSALFTTEENNLLDCL